VVVAIVICHDATGNGFVLGGRDGSSGGKNVQQYELLLRPPRWSDDRRSASAALGHVQYASVVCARLHLLLLCLADRRPASPSSGPMLGAIVMPL